MTDDWKNVGTELRARRKQLGLRQGDLAALGGPSEALVRELETGRYSSDMQDAMRGGLERAVRWRPGSLDALLVGGKPVEMPEDEEPDEATPFRLIDEQLDKALQRFQESIAELAHAEAAVDRAMRQWSLREVMSRNLKEAVEAKASELGRPLTDAEKVAFVQSMERPTPAQIAEMVGWAARYDDRDWTRYEMALIEVIEPDYPQDIRVGSSYADLEPFRDRVRRLGKIPTINELGGDLSVVDDSLAPAAEEGDIEPEGPEFNG